MRTATIVTIYVSLTVIVVLLLIMLFHWRRFRYETDRLKAWQAVYGRTGGKVAIAVGVVSHLAGAAGPGCAGADPWRWPCWSGRSRRWRPPRSEFRGPAGSIRHSGRGDVLPLRRR